MLGSWCLFGMLLAVFLVLCYLFPCLFLLLLLLPVLRCWHIQQEPCVESCRHIIRELTLPYFSVRSLTKTGSHFGLIVSVIWEKSIISTLYQQAPMPTPLVHIKPTWPPVTASSRSRPFHGKRGTANSLTSGFSFQAR